MAYLMESDLESERLEWKTNDALLDEQLTWLGVGLGSRVLDLGCGSGAATRRLAAMVGPTGRAVGLDGSSERLRQANKLAAGKGAKFVVGAAEVIPYESGVFDAVWCRFLFEYLARPDVVMGEIARVLRPGGKAVISDLDGNCIVHGGCDEEFDRELRAATDWLEKSGSSPFLPNIGRELWPLVSRASLRPQRIDVRGYHAIAGSIGGAEEVAWMMKISQAVAGLVKSGWPIDRAERLGELFVRHLRAPDTCTLSMLITVLAQKPVSDAPLDRAGQPICA